MRGVPSSAKLLLFSLPRGGLLKKGSDPALYARPLRRSAHLKAAEPAGRRANSEPRIIGTNGAGGAGRGGIGARGSYRSPPGSLQPSRVGGFAPLCSC